MAPSNRRVFDDYGDAGGERQDSPISVGSILGHMGRLCAVVWPLLVWWLSHELVLFTLIMSVMIFGLTFIMAAKDGFRRPWTRVILLTLWWIVFNAMLLLGFDSSVLR